MKGRGHYYPYKKEPYGDSTPVSFRFHIVLYFQRCLVANFDMIKCSIQCGTEGVIGEGNMKICWQVCTLGCTWNMVVTLLQLGWWIATSIHGDPQCCLNEIHTQEPTKWTPMVEEHHSSNYGRFWHWKQAHGPPHILQKHAPGFDSEWLIIVGLSNKEHGETACQPG